MCVFLTKDNLWKKTVYQAHLICVNWDVVNYQLSGFKPLFNFKKSSNIVTIFGYTLFLYGLTFCYISFHSFFLRNWKQREIEGNLIISNQYLSLAVSHYAALSSHYFYIFFANNSHFWPLSSINSFTLIPNLRQLKFTIMWQYKF